MMMWLVVLVLVFWSIMGYAFSHSPCLSNGKERSLQATDLVHLEMGLHSLFLPRVQFKGEEWSLEESLTSLHPADLPLPVQNPTRPTQGCMVMVKSCEILIVIAQVNVHKRKKKISSRGWLKLLPPNSLEGVIAMDSMGRFVLDVDGYLVKA